MGVGDVYPSDAATGLGTPPPRLFRDLPMETQREILRDAVQERYAAGDPLEADASGTPISGIITSGLVRTYLRDGNSRQQTIRYLSVGELVGAANLFGRTVPPAECLSDVRLVRLMPDSVRRLMQADAAVAIAVAQVVLDNHAAALEELALTSFRNIRERVAHQLLLRARAEGPVLDMTQRDLALSVGSVREVVGRAMHEFERTGAVRRRDNGTLELDLDALEEIQSGAERRTRKS